MALKIQNTGNTYQLSGRLNSTIVKEIRPFFIHKIKESEIVTIDISDLDDIDLSGAMLMSDLYERAQKGYKTFKVLAKNNQKILGPFRQLYTEYLLAA
ncbi:hypothetical protein POV27_16645 [Aureisphaera galaxeae]|uniref:STAS domain-containing protein n=1 Tax=Aureisphaera galaxeae TaxID=1538023 RepID=UPI0023507D80|nr:STAS domain-containing protein [Aureisphaera galaxeae]MDC8005689.1 hypothetical protein [Aureisphaera galaxeae]